MEELVRLKQQFGENHESGDSDYEPSSNGDTEEESGDSSDDNCNPVYDRKVLVFEKNLIVCFAAVSAAVP